jgi:hypothetical protein
MGLNADIINTIGARPDSKIDVIKEKEVGFFLTGVNVNTG